MSSEWELKTLGEFCPFKYGKGLPERDRKPGGYGVFSSAGLVGSHEAAYVNSPGVVIGRKGTVGSVTYSSEPFWPIDTAFYVEDQPEIRDIRFTYYLLKTLNLHLMNTDSAVPGLNRENAHALEVRVPPMAEQKSIANFLQHLDDRITLLRETNTTLEAIAQALFKSWFVDFDPVHAKMQGRAPEGMDEATAALFPDSFEDSELGPVPKGWSIGSMSDLCVIASGKRPTNRSDLPSDNCNIPLYGGAGLMGYTTESLFDDKKIVTGRVGTLGRVHIAYPPCWASDNVLVLSPRDENFFSFSLEWLRGIDVHALNRGSTQPLLTQKDLGAQTGLIPHRALLQKFEEISTALNEQIRLQTLQVEMLINVRDTLLPRLISGEFHASSNEGEAA